jgi:hypothetical protein
MGTISAWNTVNTLSAVLTSFTILTGWTDWTLWTGWGLASTDAVVAFSVWLFKVAQRRNFFSHGDFDFIFGDNLSVDIQTGLFDKQFFVPFTCNAVFADSFEVVLDNWDDGVDVQLSLDHGVQVGDIFWFDVSVWVRVTVGDNDDDLFPASLFRLSDNLDDFLETNVQKGTFVKSFQFVQFSRKSAVVQVFSEFNIHPGLFGVSNNRESGVNTQFVFVVNVSGD